MIILSGVAGNPILHSLSPAIFDFLFKKYKVDAKYLKISCENEVELTNLIKELNLSYINITSPLKQKVLTNLDYKDYPVKKSNSCNTIVNYKNKLYGFNTDIIALKKILEDNVFNIYFQQNENIKNKGNINILLLGAGGAAYSVLYAINIIVCKLTKNGINLKINVDILNRTKSKAIKLRDQFIEKDYDFEYQDNKNYKENSNLNNENSEIDCKNKKNDFKNNIFNIKILDSLQDKINKLVKVDVDNYDVIINTIPDNNYLQKLFGKCDELNKKNMIIIDANYKNSYFQEFSRIYGFKFIGGLNWLILQAVEGFNIFCKFRNKTFENKTNIFENNKFKNNKLKYKDNKSKSNLLKNNKIKNNFLLEKIKKHVLKSKKKFLNKNKGIAIIGFMGSGKSTIGKKVNDNISVINKKINNKRINIKYFDTDEIIEKDCNMPIAEIFEKYGEKKFRKIEKKILKKIINGNWQNRYKNVNNKKINSYDYKMNKKNRIGYQNNNYDKIDNNTDKIILSAGGGAILNKSIRNLLKKKFIVVWLVNNFETTISRIEKDSNVRPLAYKKDDFKSNYKLRKNDNLNNEPILNEKVIVDKKNLKKMWESRKKFYAEISDIVVFTENKEINQICLQVINEIKEYL